MAISDWPKDERPREKLLEKGAASLSDAELLAIFLRSGSRGRTAVDVGRDMLKRTGSLRGLLDLPPARLAQLPGMSSVNRRALVLGALELGKRYLATELKRGFSLDNPEPAARLLTAELRGEPREVFAVLFLDNKHRVIGFEKMFYGTVDGAAVYPREVVRRALEFNAASVIVGHNHPSGVAEPSQADRDVTDRLRRALELVDVRVLDHLVIGDGHWESFSRRGWV